MGYKYGDYNYFTTKDVWKEWEEVTKPFKEIIRKKYEPKKGVET